ncbi:MAG: response regulator transcription factor [Treponema sp.]|jgi:DNA-binding NarL/FixJ family response regulator|nr:response regulator transcription factor [Treponema sp.]
MIKIVLIDGQDTYREGMKILLSAQGDFEILGVGKDEYEAIRLVDSLKPDIALIDINLHFIDGAQVISLLKYRSPATAIIILTSLDSDEYIHQAICGGASAYLLKGPEVDNIAEKIRTIYNGGSLMAPEITTKVFRMFSELAKNRYNLPGVYSIPEENLSMPSNISNVELRIMGFIGRGLSNQEIAEQLCLRVGTVRNYISSVLQKTALRDRTQVAIFAIHNGLIVERKTSSPGFFT